METPHEEVAQEETVDHLADRLEQIRYAAAQYQSPQHGPGLLAALAPPDRTVQLEAVLRLHGLRQGLSELLVADERFLGNVPRMTARLGGASGFYPEFVAGPLIHRLLETDSVANSIRWLQKVLTTEAAEGLYITALWNVPVGGDVQLTPRVRLVPFEELPDSEQKRWLTNQASAHGPVHTMFADEPPSSALVVPYRVEPFLRDPNEPPQLDQDYIDLHTLISEITLVLTLIGPRVPLHVAHWFTFNDPDLESAQLGRSSGTQSVEILPRRFPATPPPMLNAEEAQQTIEQFLGMQPQPKKKVITATSRLRLALSRHHAGDQAVELSIALETLMGDTGNAEMTHKVSVRAVRMLGGSADVRARNFAILKRTYEARSKVVHQGEQASGTVNIAGERMTVDAVVTEAAHLCAELIKVVVRRGALPSWAHFDINEHPSE